MNEVNKRLFQPDVSRFVKKARTVPKETFNQSQWNEIQNQLWKQYCVNLCKLELSKHKRLNELQEDPNFSKERRYYVSTPARRMFKKLMCLKRFEEAPVTVVDIASMLHLSHKAASDLIKDSIAFDTITESVLEGRKRYVAQEWWSDSFMRNGAHWHFVHGETTVRSRWLYTEFARHNQEWQSDNHLDT